MDRIDALLDQVVKVCPLPGTTQRVLALTASDTSSVPEVSAVISTDPALAAAVLSVANSAAFGAGKIDRLEIAVMRLGLRELHNLAAAMALFAAFRSPAELSLELHELCVASGSIAHRLAKHTNVVPPGTALVCGLLCEIGAMACLVFDGKNYVHLWQEANAELPARMQLEAERYGATSFEIGQRFLERNSLPASVSSAVGARLDLEHDSLPPLAKITLLARHSPLIRLQNVGNPELALAAFQELTDRVGLSGVDARVLADACEETRNASSR
jgi:HD-like signal output (HDOD) protein